MHADDVFAFAIMFVIGSHLYEEVGNGEHHVNVCLLFVSMSVYKSASIRSHQKTTAGGLFRGVPAVN